MQTIWKFIIFIILVVGLVFGFKFLAPTQKRVIVSDDFTYGNGRIAATEVMVTPKVSGRIEEIFVNEGDIVARGKKIAKLDTKELEARLTLVQAQIQQAIENKNYALAILEQKESEYTLALQNFKRAQSLYKKAAISKQAHEQEEGAYKARLATLKAAKAGVAQANESINVAKAEAAILQVHIDESVLYAPVKGRVLYKLAQNGEVIGAGQNVVVLLDLLDTYMSVYLPTSQAGLIEYGAEVRIILDALPHIAIPAKVTFISPQAQFTPKQIETQDERAKLMFRIKVNIDTSLLEKYIDKVKTGLPGVVYLPLVSNPTWPQKLSNLPRSMEEKNTNMN